MIKIVAIIGSPRKGETYRAVANFEKLLGKYEDTEVEYVMLSNIGFQDCTGCHNCIMKGHEYCREAAKVEELKEKMLSADAVILATPVYNQHVTALMKKFLDYFTYLWHRPELFGKKFFGISSGGGMFKDVFKFLRMNVQSWGGVWMGELGVPHYDSLTPKYKEKCDRDFMKKAEIFLRGVAEQGLPVPGIGRLMSFNMWKINAIGCKNTIPADFSYWADRKLFDSCYYYPARIGIHKKVIIIPLTFVLKIFMKKVFSGYEDV